jgi:hypothetical protein
MKWTLLLSLPLVGCVGSPRPPAPASVARASAWDSTTVRELCAKPDSVLAGQANCELRDQRQPPTVLPKPTVGRPPSD